MTKGIYSITNALNGARYVGSSVEIEKRWKQHKIQLVSDSHHSVKLQKAWNKYGRNAFKWEIIEVIDDPTNSTLTEREQYWIDKYDSYHNGYNDTPIASRPNSLSDQERVDRDATIAFEKYYGLFKPKYVKKIKSRPLEYDESAQETWQRKFDQHSRKHQRQLILGWIVIIGFIGITWSINPGFGFFSLYFGAFIGGWLVIRYKEQLASVRKSEPRYIAEQKRNQMIDEEKKKWKRSITGQVYRRW